MIRALWTGATGMRAQQFMIDSIAHDLTNVNTVGYKKKFVSFTDLFYQGLRASGVQGQQGYLPTGIQVGHGVRVSGTAPMLTRGNAIETGTWSDMMIEDSGNITRNFFRILLPDGTYAYTRDGTFRVDDQGRLATNDGYFLDPLPGNIPNDAVQVTVTPEGYVEVIQGADRTATRIGQISLWTFANPGGLEPIGENLWKESATSGAAQQGTPGSEGFGKIRSGWLEQSNVDAITEMVNMIAAQRAYEFNSRSIQTSDEMLQTVNSLKR